MNSASSSAAPEVTRDGGWTPRLLLSTLTMILAIEANALGYSLIPIALPAITAHFQTTQGGWLISAYTLTGAICCPLVGKLADIYGKRRLILVCLTVSLVGSMISLLAPSFAMLVVGRVVQGAICSDDVPVLLADA